MNSKEVVAIVKIRNYETGDRNREKLCYIESSPKYLYYDDKYFFRQIKLLIGLEKFLTKKDVNYELELITDQEIALERFNKQLKDEELLTFYIYSSRFTMDYLSYLKDKTEDKHLINLLIDAYDNLSQFGKGTDQFYRLEVYMKELMRPIVETPKNNKRKSR